MPIAPRFGFSLIEIVLAIGIIGFCLTTLLGMMSVGMSSHSSARARTVSARIFQTVANDNQLASGFGVSSSRKYFDFDGNQVDVASKDIHFVANIVPFLNFKIPSSHSANGATLIRVAIQVCAQRNNENLTTDSEGLIASAPGRDLITRAVYVTP